MVVFVVDWYRYDIWLLDMHSWQFVFPFWLTALFNGICYWWKNILNVWWVLLFAMVMESCTGNFPLKLLVFFLFLMMVDCPPSRAAYGLGYLSLGLRAGRSECVLIDITQLISVLSSSVCFLSSLFSSCVY